jgi:hypothetical protein
MKNARVLTTMFILLFALAGCADLTVKSLVVHWNDNEKTAKAEIANIGKADAGPFMVYFNPEENPESQNHRPQVGHRVQGLAKGASITLDANFMPLAHPDNHNLANVYKIVVLVDPKGMVRESNENNNVKESGLTP